ncbi:MAG: hypothetical protein ABEK04_03645, partial [Candidatus Nanohalobium sp.]
MKALILDLVVQVLALPLLGLAAWKDVKDRKVWLGLGNLLIGLGLISFFSHGATVEPFLVLLGPALGWVAQEFKLWTSFDTRLLISVVLL